MRKSIAAAALAASVAAGGFAGAALGGPSLVGATESATASVGGWVEDALSGLVSEGTITQDQADAVESALEEARPERPFGPGRFDGHPRLSIVADALGISEADLRAALEDGDTIAEVAAAHDVDPQKAIDALVAAHKARLDEAVADGDLTQAQADERLARAEERATALVNGELRDLRRRRFGLEG